MDSSSYVASLFGMALWALLPGFIAAKKERSFWGYYFLSFLITPLLSMIIILILPSKADPGTNKKEEKKKELAWNQQMREAEARKAGNAASLLLIHGVDDYGECPSCHNKVRIGSLKCDNCGLLLKPSVDGQCVVPKDSDIAGFVECPVCHNKQLAGADSCFSCKVRFIKRCDENPNTGTPEEEQEEKKNYQGNSRLTARYCRICGAELTGATTFCNFCGTKTIEISEE